MNSLSNAYTAAATTDRAAHSGGSGDNTIESFSLSPHAAGRDACRPCFTDGCAGQVRQAGPDPRRISGRRHRRSDRSRCRRQAQGQSRRASHRRQPARRDRSHRGRSGEERRTRRHDAHGHADRADGGRSAQHQESELRSAEGFHADRARVRHSSSPSRPVPRRAPRTGRNSPRGSRRTRTRPRTRRRARAACRTSSASCFPASWACRCCTLRTKARRRTSTT